MSSLMTGQVNFVKDLAAFAYGTGGRSEGANGGKGNMGILYDTQGHMHIIKCNTHRSQAAAAQREVDKGRGNADLIAASEKLRQELLKLAQSVKMDDQTVDALLGSGNGTKLMERKIVARFITELKGRVNNDQLEGVWENARDRAVTSKKDMSFNQVTSNDMLVEFNTSTDGQDKEVLNNIRDRYGMFGADTAEEFGFREQYDGLAEFTGKESLSVAERQTCLDAIGSFEEKLGARLFTTGGQALVLDLRNWIEQNYGTQLTKHQQERMLLNLLNGPFKSSQGNGASIQTTLSGLTSANSRQYYQRKISADDLQLINSLADKLGGNCLERLGITPFEGTLPDGKLALLDKIKQLAADSKWNGMDGIIKDAVKSCANMLPEEKLDDLTDYFTNRLHQSIVEALEGDLDVSLTDIIDLVKAPIQSLKDTLDGMDGPADLVGDPENAVDNELPIDELEGLLNDLDKQLRKHIADVLTHGGEIGDLKAFAEESFTKLADKSILKRRISTLTKIFSNEIAEEFGVRDLCSKLPESGSLDAATEEECENYRNVVEDLCLKFGFDRKTTDGDFLYKAIMWKIKVSTYNVLTDKENSRFLLKLMQGPFASFEDSGFEVDNEFNKLTNDGDRQYCWRQCPDTITSIFEKQMKPYLSLLDSDVFTPGGVNTSRIAPAA